MDRTMAAQTDIKGEITRLVVDDCNLSGSRIENTGMSGTVIDNANLSALKLNNVSLSGASIHDANMAGCAIDGATLAGASITDTNLTGVRIENCRGVDDMIIDGIRVGDLMAAHKSAQQDSKLDD